MPRYAVRRIADVPRVADGDADDPDWHPLQHHLGLKAFGANVFVAREAGQALVEEHDESASGHEELYVVLAGEAEFTLDGERTTASAQCVVAVLEPSVVRRAVARVAGTMLLALGAPVEGRFHTTWRSSHFDDVPRVST
jgi:quercetin dioxygenase-like cupin family protein